MSNSNNNQLNIPQAPEAMDKFKMQAAQEDIHFAAGFRLAGPHNVIQAVHKV